MKHIVFDSSTAALFRRFTEEPVICLNDDCSIGHPGSEQRLEEMRVFNPETPDSFMEERNEFVNEIQNIGPDEEIMIWASLSPFELSGLYFTASLLADIRAEIKAVIPGNEYACAKLIPDRAEYERLKDTAVHLNTNELSRRWVQLCEENAVLRVSENGILLSASEGYYDPWLEKYIGDPLCISKTVNNICEEKNQLISAWYLSWRLKKIQSHN